MSTSVTGPIRMGAPKDTMEGRKLLPAGRYAVRCDGFKPRMSKPKPGVEPSVNLFPILKVVNHPSLNGETIGTPMNQKAGFILKAFCHMLGHDVELQGDSYCIPGGFLPDPMNPNDVSKMVYQGPLVGAVGELELGVGMSNRNKPQNFIKQYFCRVPACKEEHPTELT